MRMSSEKADEYSEYYERISTQKEWIGRIAAFYTVGAVAMCSVNYFFDPDERMKYTYIPLAVLVVLNTAVITYLHHLSKLESILLEAELNEYEEDD